MALYIPITPIKIIRIFGLAAQDKALSVHLRFCMRIILSTREAHFVLNAPWIVAMAMIISILLTIEFRITEATQSLTRYTI
jgi:hypothetical protein